MSGESMPAAYPAEEALTVLRRDEFSRLGDAIYLDHAGATLHSEAQLREVMGQLNRQLMGNPHSQNESSQRAGEAVERVRQLVLKHFNAPQGYSVVFTANASAALKLVGEAFPWRPGSQFVCTLQNHNSVLGIREYAAARGAAFEALSYAKLAALLEEAPAADEEGQAQPPGGAGAGVHSLLAFPGECNFSGMKLDLRLSAAFQRGRHGRPSTAGRWLTLLDAAKLAATSPLDLTAHPADFVAISFYKMFGYPTGLGALLVRDSAAALLQRPYFAGGTVEAVIADAHFHKPRASPSARFEDGTVSFLAIASLVPGFRQLARLGMSAISQHTHALASLAHRGLSELRHSGSGAAVCEFYGFDEAAERHGSILNFSLLRPDGRYVGYREVEKLACIHGLQLRTGGFCNPGATQHFLGLSHAQVKRHVELGHVCWDDHDLLDGLPTGSVRTSFGYMSSEADVRALVAFVNRYFVSSTDSSFVDGKVPLVASGAEVPTSTELVIRRVLVYPVKSCGGMEVERWPLGPHGLLYDREWAVVDAAGESLNLKNEGGLARILPSIDLDTRTMTLTLAPPPLARGEADKPDESDYGSGSDDDDDDSATMQPAYSGVDSLPPLTISLDESVHGGAVRRLTVCGDSCSAALYSGSVQHWLSAALGRDCSLTRIPVDYVRTQSDDAGPGAGPAPSLSFANEGQFLVLCNESLRDLLGRLPPDCEAATAAAAAERYHGVSTDIPTVGAGEPWVTFVARFRPNIVLEGLCGGQPYAEDSWGMLTVADAGADTPPIYLQSFKPCNRCGAVNVAPRTGTRSKEPYLTLAQYRRQQGKVLFGALFSRAQPLEGGRQVLAVGARVVPAPQ
jgi:molybdenum cofactor sulfurtransferase